jgi:hypothetical protein
MTELEIMAEIATAKARLAWMRTILDNPAIDERSKPKIRESVNFWSRNLASLEARLLELRRYGAQP